MLVQAFVQIQKSALNLYHNLPRKEVCAMIVKMENMLQLLLL